MSNYTYEETPEVMLFWESILTKLYGGKYKEIEWFPPNSYQDVALKQDLVVIMIRDTHHYYQLKTATRRYEKDNTVFFNLNIKQAIDYYESDYPIDVIAFGSPFSRIAILFKVSDFKLLWENLREYKIKNHLEYVTFSIKDVERYGVYNKIVMI